jgi:predicted nucleic acid-binding protein
MDGLRALHHDLLPVVRVAWVDEATHDLAIAMVLAANRRALSLVDAASFHVMRRLGLTVAFAFDPHFGEQGFGAVP